MNYGCGGARHGALSLLPLAEVVSGVCSRGKEIPHSVPKVPDCGRGQTGWAGSGVGAGDLALLTIL